MSDAEKVEELRHLWWALEEALKSQADEDGFYWLIKVISEKMGDVLK